MVFLRYTSTDSVNRSVSPGLSMHWGMKLARDCSSELDRSVGIAGTQPCCSSGAEQRVPWAGRSPGSVPGCCGPERCRGDNSRCQRWPADRAEREPAQAPGSSVPWKGRGRGKVRGRQCQELLKGYPFDVREMLGYSS